MSLLVFHLRKLEIYSGSGIAQWGGYSFTKRVLPKTCRKDAHTADIAYWTLVARSAMSSMIWNNPADLIRGELVTATFRRPEKGYSLEKNPLLSRMANGSFKNYKRSSTAPSAAAGAAWTGLEIITFNFSGICTDGDTRSQESVELNWSKLKLT